MFRAYQTKNSENRAKPQDRDVAARAKLISIEKHSERNKILVRGAAIDAYAIITTISSVAKSTIKKAAGNAFFLENSQHEDIAVPAKI